jgi:GGDEF domain-containing protein
MPDGLSELMLGWGLQFVLAITAVSFLLFAVITYYYNLSHEALEKARRDPLTALYNKGSIVEQVDAQLKDNFAGYGAFLMMDVDHFKTVNDSFGHPMGDQILRNVASVLECE